MFYKDVYDDETRNYGELLSSSSTVFMQMGLYIKNTLQFMDGDDFQQTYINRFVDEFNSKFYEYMVENPVYTDDTKETFSINWYHDRFKRIFKLYQKIFEDRIKGYYSVYSLNDIMQGYKRTKATTGNITEDNQKVTSGTASEQGRLDTKNNRREDVNGSVTNKDYELPQVRLVGSDYTEVEGNLTEQNNNTHQDTKTNVDTGVDTHSLSNTVSNRDDIDNVKTYLENNTEFDTDIIEVWNKYDKYVKDIIKEFVEKFKSCFRLIFL